MDDEIDISTDTTVMSKLQRVCDVEMAVEMAEEKSVGVVYRSAARSSFQFTKSKMFVPSAQA